MHGSSWRSIIEALADMAAEGRESALSCFQGKDTTQREKLTREAHRGPGEQRKPPAYWLGAFLMGRDRVVEAI